MQNKIVLFLGAGFSIGAKIPMQNKILEEMVRDTTNVSKNQFIEPESVKFLYSYIEVGLFLLKKFSAQNTCCLDKKFLTIKKLQSLLDILNDTNENTNISGNESFFVDLFNNNETALKKEAKAQHYKLLAELKENIRKALIISNMNVDLEDIFTIFDKSLKDNENWGEYTYIELDILRHALLRLFTYYFGKRISKFSTSKSKIYDGFVNFCKNNNVMIITTNWDTIVEMLFDKNSISYHTNLLKTNQNGLQICKLHGSMNWFKCNCCGEYQLVDYKNIALHLLDDDKPERCETCCNEALTNQVVLQPEIITPTMLKILNNKLFREIWADAATALADAEKIIFVGYSLPLADFEIRYLLRKHIKRDAIIEVVLSKKDQPSAKDQWVKPEGRFKNLFPCNNIKFNYSGFEKYFIK